ncbi:MAG TPA: GntR family transcriptional regulator [Candidatus Atribacteria bacterium]|nr:GntR family transcriptional regulator [Candidatus Atribacteria bacterium]
MDFRLKDPSYSDELSLRQQVFNYILEAVLSGRFKPGEPLTELKLAEELGVSRTPVREALRQLEYEGLASSIPNKGVIVNGISETDIEEIYAIRALVEGLAVKWAAERITDKQRSDLEETFELMSFYTRKKDYQQLGKYDARFHNLLFDSCQSKVLRHILRMLMRYVEHARIGSFRVSERAEQALEEHRAILEAVLEGSADKARDLMTMHINNALVDLMEQRKAGEKKDQA